MYGEWRDAFELPGFPVLFCCPGLGEAGGGAARRGALLWCRANHGVFLLASSSERQIWEGNHESVAQLYSKGRSSYVQQVIFSAGRGRSR